MKHPDHIALNDLMARYVDGANRRDGRLWLSTWAEDARWRLMGMEVQGRDAIFSMWEQALQMFEFALLLPSSGRFDVAGDRASGHWYLQELTRTHDGSATCMISRYQDSYSRIDGNWLYQSREYTVIYSGPPDLSGQFNPLPAQQE
jgi:ketosteroid isomerase-like protein